MEEFRKAREELEGRITWGNFSGCNRCRVPQGICLRWRDSTIREFGWERSGGDCQYPSLIMDVITAMWGVQKDHTEKTAFKMMIQERIISEEAQFEVAERKMWEWFGRKDRIGRLEVNGICKLILELGEI